MGTGILTSTGSSSSDVTVSGGGIAPSICEALTKTVSGTSVSLKWSDPDDTVIDSQYLCSWGGTKIVRKAGSYPANESDGTVIVDNTTRNQYQTTAYMNFASGTFQYGSWKNAFFMPTPVMLKYDGTEDYALYAKEVTTTALSLQVKIIR